MKRSDPNATRRRIGYVAVAVAVAMAALLFALIDASGSTPRAPGDRTESGKQDVSSPDPGREVPDTGAPGGSTDAKPVDGVVRVRVLGRDDTPLEGVRFKRAPGKPEFSGPTDADGWTSWIDESGAAREWRAIDSLLDREHEIVAPITTVRLPDLLPLEVEFVDAETGAVIEDDASGVALPDGMARTVHGRTRRELLVTPIEAGSSCDVSFPLVPPDGMTGESGLEEGVRAYVSRYATAARLRVPVWPEWRLTLVLRNRDGGVVPQTDTRIAEVTAEGRTICVRIEPGERAEHLAIRGAPFWPGTPVTLRLGLLSWQLAIDRRNQHESLVLEDAERGVRGRGGRRKLPLASARETTTLRVHVRGPRGAPALGVPVRVQEWPCEVFRRWSADTDELGDARFTDLPHSRIRVAALDAALGYPQKKLDLRSGEAMTCVLEPVPGRTVTFVSRGDEPVAGARLFASSWFGAIAPPVVDGVQDLAAITGPGGEFVWPGFPTGSVSVRAERGTRHGSLGIDASQSADRITVQLEERKR